MLFREFGCYRRVAARPAGSRLIHACKPSARTVVAVAIAGLGIANGLARCRWTSRQRLIGCSNWLCRKSHTGLTLVLDLFVRRAARRLRDDGTQSEGQLGAGPTAAKFLPPKFKPSLIRNAHQASPTAANTRGNTTSPNAQLDTPRRRRCDISV